MNKIFSELQRRNVIRVALAYTVAGWVILQIGDVLFDVLEVPDWAGKLLVAFLILGFPPTLIFAWAFELTPEGLKTEAEVDRSESVTSVTAKKLDVITIVLLVAALGAFAADRLLVSRQPPPTTPIAARDRTPAEASIAVLPFENISQDAANDPFTIGIHDDLLTYISKISSLKTISRTSVLKYRDTIEPVQVIAQELGVATIVEGSVQRSGDRVRINVQLINALSDEQIWAERYDRQLTAANIFAIQSEIARAIAEALQTTLTSDEETRIEQVPTENLAALEAYFLGRQLMAERNAAALEQAIYYFKRAIALDPEFALAYVALSESYQIQEDIGGLSREEMFANAGAAVAKALILDSNLGPAYTALGGLKMSEGDYLGAEEMFKKSIALNSNYVTTYHWYGILLQDMGRVEEAATAYRNGVERDPLSAQLNESLGSILEFQGRFDEALNQYKRSVTIDENFASSYLYVGNIHWMASGRPDDAIACQKMSIALDRRVGRAQTWHGLLYLDLGDVTAAEQWIESSLRIAPQSQEPRAAMVLLDWYRDDKTEALRQAAEVYRLVPWYWDQRLFQSMILAILRNHDLQSGRTADARGWYETTYPELLNDGKFEIGSQNFRSAIDLAYVLQKSGDDDRASLLLDRTLEFIHTNAITRLGTAGYGIADVQIHALRGEQQIALDKLQQAIDQGWRGFWWFYLKNNPNLESLYDNAEFQSLLREVESLMVNQELTSVDADACTGL